MPENEKKTIQEQSQQQLQQMMENITCLRKKHGLSKKQMAKILHIGVGTLNKIERGEIPPRITIDLFYCVHSYFHIDPRTLLSQGLCAD